MFLVETISYEVAKKLNDIEVRRYSRIVAAKVEGYGDGGFGMLFRFISGQNSRSSRVAMTSPVLSEKVAMTAPVISGQGSIAFVMPRGYTLETTPRPIDKSIRILEIPQRYLAVLRFSGRWTERAFQAKSTELLGTLEKAGIATRGEVLFMRYNSPFSPWFLRRNEVAVEVDFQLRR